MFLTAVIFIIYFSLSDLAKWMNQNGATDKEKFFVVGGIFLLNISNHQCSCYCIIKRGEQPLFFVSAGVLMP